MCQSLYFKPIEQARIEGRIEGHTSFFKSISREEGRFFFTSIMVICILLLCYINLCPEKFLFSVRAWNWAMLNCHTYSYNYTFIHSYTISITWYTLFILNQFHVFEKICVMSFNQLLWIRSMRYVSESTAREVIMANDFTQNGFGQVINNW